MDRIDGFRTVKKALEELFLKKLEDEIKDGASIYSASQIIDRWASLNNVMAEALRELVDAARGDIKAT